jgi:integrase
MHLNAYRCLHAAYMRLNDAIVRKLPSPPTGYRLIWDTEIKGFGVRVTAAGAKSFILNYRASGVGRRHTIGSFPDWPTSAAREEAKRLKREIDQGGDPALDRREMRAAPTVADLIDRYRAEHAPRKRERSRLEDESLIRQWISPELGNRKVTDVRRADIERLHRKITERGTPVRANRILILLSRMFTLAVRWELRPDNPVEGVERNHEEPRHRYLSGDEMRRLAEALAGLRSQQAANAIRLLLLTGARRMEVLSATWDQFDLEAGVWVKPSSHTKQRKIHRVPLSEPARTLLADIRATAGRSPYLFPARSGGGHLGDVKKSWAIVCQAAKLDGVHVHDMRHSYAGILASAGLSLPVIGALLGHTQAATTQRYVHLIDDALRAATEKAGAVIGGLNKKT